MHHFSTPWKHQKTLRFSDVFRRLREGALGTNGLIYTFAWIGLTLSWRKCLWRYSVRMDFKCRWSILQTKLKRWFGFFIFPKLCFFLSFFYNFTFDTKPFFCRYFYDPYALMWNHWILGLLFSHNLGPSPDFLVWKLCRYCAFP